MPGPTDVHTPVMYGLCTRVLYKTHTRMGAIASAIRRFVAGGAPYASLQRRERSEAAVYQMDDEEDDFDGGAVAAAAPTARPSNEDIISLCREQAAKNKRVVSGSDVLRKEIVAQENHGVLTVAAASARTV